MSERMLEYDRAAREWLEALPLGNGRVGVMDWGTFPARLGLNDTWVQFVFQGATAKPLPEPDEPPDDPAPTTPGNGGIGLGTRSAANALGLPSIGQGILAQVIAQPPGYGTARGRVWPSGGNKVVRLQTKDAEGRWRTTLRVRTDRTGRWRALVPIGTAHRVVALGVAGPVVRAK